MVQNLTFISLKSEMSDLHSQGYKLLRFTMFDRLDSWWDVLGVDDIVISHIFWSSLYLLVLVRCNIGRLKTLYRVSVRIQAPGLPFVPGLPMVPFSFIHCRKSWERPLLMRLETLGRKWQILSFPTTFSALNWNKWSIFLLFRQNWRP